MSLIDATVGGASANSYLTLAEAVTYFTLRSSIPEWDDADNQEALLIMATRLIDLSLSPGKTFVPDSSMRPGYFRENPHWTGAPATSVQALAWPRTGMYNRNGFAIASNIIPQDLKYATAELAGQLAKADRTLDNDVAVQGITSIRAGSVALSFKNAGIETSRYLPDIVWSLLVPSWMTDEVIEGAQSPSFEVL